MNKTTPAQNAVTEAAQQAAQSLLAQTQPAGRVVTPDLTRATSDWRIATSAWKTLPIDVQNEWLGLAQQVNRSERRTGRRALNATAMYQRVCAVRLKCGMGLPQEAPAFVSPGGLPPVTLSAAFSSPNTLRLTLRSEPVLGLIQCFACAEVLAGQPVRHASHWLCLGTLNGLQTQTDITALYRRKMPPPARGCKVCVRLVPVAETGLRGGPLLVTAVVPE